jgi:ABC-type transporter Mla subunit MlaD
MFELSQATLENLLSKQTQIIVAAINKQGETIMSTQSTSITDIQNSLAALTAAQQQVSTDIASAVSDITALSAQVASLQAQGGATPQQLAGLKTSIDQITANLTGASTGLEAVLPAPATTTTPSSSTSSTTTPTPSTAPSSSTSSPTTSSIASPSTPAPAGS